MTIRHFMNLVEASQRKAAPATFALHPSLDPADYDLTDSFSDVKRWKARTYIGDGTIKKGTMPPVGFVWISTEDNTIIPISRGDEHHEGADMVRTMSRKAGWDVNFSNYIPVFWAHNYIYYKKDAPRWQNVLAKFLHWGGKDGVLEGQNDFRNLSTSYSHFVQTGTLAPAETGTLAPLGQAFYHGHKNLAAAIQAARANPQPGPMRQAFQAALALAQFIDGCGLSLTFAKMDYDFVRAMPKAIRALAKEKDLQGLEEMFFGFDSVKRAIHEAIRHLDPKDTWSTPKAVAFFGDIKLAESLLAHI